MRSELLNEEGSVLTNNLTSNEPEEWDGSFIFGQFIIVYMDMDVFLKQDANIVRVVVAEQRVCLLR
jgi:hypothetical protein